MKYVFMQFLLFFLSINALAMETAEYKSPEGKCVIARASHDIGIFSFTHLVLNGGRPWFAITVEPFHRMTCFSEESNFQTSPVRRVSKENGVFFVYTKNSVYRITEEQLATPTSMKEFKELYTICYKNEPDAENIDFYTYMRREAEEIKKDIEDRQILNNQDYKTWISYNEKHDAKIFTTTIKDLNNGEEVIF